MNENDRTNRMTIATGKSITLKGCALRSAAVVSILTVALSLSACGGGGDSAALDVSVVVAGQPVNGGNIGPGSSPTIYVRAGQSIELDASESVIWTLYVAGTAVSGSGTTVSYGSADVTLTTVSPSRIAVDTFAAFPLANPIPVTLVATSTFDSAQVATVNVLITN